MKKELNFCLKLAAVFAMTAWGAFTIFAGPLGNVGIASGGTALTLPVSAANGGTGAATLGTSKQPVLGNGTSAFTASAAPTTADALADAIIGTSAITQKGLMLQGKAGQTASVLEVQGSNGTSTFAVVPPATTFTGTSATIAGAGSAVALTSGSSNTVYGTGSLLNCSTGQHNTVIGPGCVTGSSFNSSSNTIVGSGVAAAATYNASNNTLMGQGAASSLTTGQNEIIIGTNGVANVVTTGSGNIIIGVGGQAELVGTANTCVLGGSSSAITNIYSNKGIVHATPTAITLHGTGGSGSDIVGAHFNLAGGFGTGLADCGYIGHTYPLKGTTGSTLQTMSTLNNWIGGYIYVSTADVTLTASTATTGTVIGAQTNALPQGTLTLDANLLRIGSLVRIKAHGIATMSAGGPTLKFDAKLGAVVIASATVASNAAGITSGVVEVEAILVCRSLGASGTVMGDGTVHSQLVVASGTALAWPMNKAVTTVDTTASNAIDLFCTWSANTAGNSVTITNVTIEYR